MRNKTVGRNDPCPCGSGRKYKRCCLAEAERRAAQKRESVPELGEDAPSVAPPADLDQLSGMMQKLARKTSSGKERALYEDLLAKTQPIIDYMKQQPAIEAAAQAIEAQRVDFEKLVEDQETYNKRTRLLFAEERFVSLRFTVDDVERAFNEVGRPTPGSSDDSFVATVRKAILHLADKDRRSWSAMSLLMLMPDYVAANRPLDAWILQHCSYLTRAACDDSNPFLFQMFSHGYEGWVAEEHVREEALLRQVGMDRSRLERMSMEEIDAWLQEQEADPTQRARLEKLLLANPAQRAQAEANLQQSERDAHKLLERQDVSHLFLSPDEIQPWLPELNEAVASVYAQFSDLTTPSPSAAAGEAFMGARLPLVREMIAELFTPERIGSLAAQLKTYRNERFAAGDKRAAELANGAHIYVKNEDEPGCNQFLCILGYLSIMKAIEAMANPAQDAGSAPAGL